MNEFKGAAYSALSLVEPKSESRVSRTAADTVCALKRMHVHRDLRPTEDDFQWRSKTPRVPSARKGIGRTAASPAVIRIDILSEELSV